MYNLYMTKTLAQQSTLFTSISPFTRILNRDRTLYALLETAEKKDDLPIHFLHKNQSSNIDDYAQIDRAQADYAQIDPALTISPSTDAASSAPQTGLSYAGFTPAQRHAFLTWLQQPTASAAPAFQTLYLAHLETCLFEQNTLSKDARLVLKYLHEVKTWGENVSLSRASLLAHWLEQDSAALVESIESGHVHADQLGVAVGHVALLGQLLTPQMLRVLMEKWRITNRPFDGEMARVRLSSLTSTLGTDPLAYALKELGEEAATPRRWRSAHRELRIALPQPDLHPILVPLLNEIGSLSASTITFAEAPSEEMTGGKEGEDGEPSDQQKWNLVLEFQQSRSEYFDFALHRARQRPGYSQLMDEDRRIIHRVMFMKRELRHFWSLWEYVKSWTGTEVHVNGKTVDHWKIWPHSPHLR